MFDLKTVSAASGIPEEGIRILQSVDSTNRLGKEILLSRDESAEMILSSSQTAGRGRMGREFRSPEGGVYLSCLFRAPLPPESLTRLTIAAAVCAADAVNSLIPEPVGVKWVNDLFLHGKKIAGILTEGVFAPDYRGAVVGIGLNLKKGTLPASLSDIASSIERETGTLPDPSLLAGRIAKGLRETLPRLNDRFPELLAEYRTLSVLDGKEVTVLGGGVEYPATVLGIGENGELLVRTEGKTIPLTSGEVSIRFR